MPTKGWRRTWVKLFVTGWLHGSIRWQLEPDERSVWADLICIAGQCGHEGAICDNDGETLPRDFIASQLNIKQTLLDRTIAKSIHDNRLADVEGCLYIVNWPSYQSEYERQKLSRKSNKPKPVNDDILDANLGAIHRCYEDNIGLLTPILADHLKDISDTYPEGWFEKAVAIACEKNARNLKYVSKILQRWLVEGVDSDGTRKTTGHERIQVYEDD